MASASEYAQRLAERRARRLRATHLNDQALADHAARLQMATGLRRRMLELHQPVADVSPSLPLLCMGCDGEVGENGEPATYPCRSYDLAATPAHVLD